MQAAISTYGRFNTLKELSKNKYSAIVPTGKYQITIDNKYIVISKFDAADGDEVKIPKNEMFDRNSTFSAYANTIIKAWTLSAISELLYTKLPHLI